MSTSEARRFRLGRRRCISAVLTAAFVVSTLGGCNVTVGNSEREKQRSAADDLLGNGVVVDLAAPPNRDDLAVGEGRTTVYLEREDREPFEVTVRFRDGHELTTTAAVLGVHTDGPGTPPHGVTIRRDRMTVEELESALDAGVDALGVAREDAERVVAEARRTPEGDADLIRSLPTAVQPPDELTLEPVVTAMEGRVSLNYLVRWGSS